MIPKLEALKDQPVYPNEKITMDVKDIDVTFVYQFAVCKPDNKKKQFVVERDLIFKDSKFTKEELHEVSEQHKCDVMVSYIGMLVKPTLLEEFDYRVDYHDKKMVKEIRKKWKQ